MVYTLHSLGTNKKKETVKNIFPFSINIQPNKKLTKAQSEYHDSKIFTKSSFFVELRTFEGIKLSLGNPLIILDKFGNIIHNLQRFSIPQETSKALFWKITVFWLNSTHFYLLLYLPSFTYHDLFTHLFRSVFFSQLLRFSLHK